MLICAGFCDTALFVTRCVRTVFCCVEDDIEIGVVVSKRLDVIGFELA